MISGFYGGYMKKILLFGMLFYFTSLAQSNFWVQTNGLYSDSVRSLSVNWDGVIFAGTMSSAYRTSNNGDTWEKISDFSLLIETSPDSNLYALGDSGVYRSTNEGNTWELEMNGMNERNIYSIIINSKKDIFASTAHGIYKSIDKANNWTKIDTNFVNSEVHFVSIYPNDNLLASVHEDGLYLPKGLYLSTDDGNSWNSISNGAYSSFVWCAAVNTSGEIFAGVYAYGIYKSTDEGQHWTHQTNGIPSNYIYPIAMIINGAGKIYVGTIGGYGVFTSSDDGESWDTLNSGLGNIWVNCFAMDSSGVLYCGTEAHGIFKSKSSTTLINNVSSKIPDRYELIQNYPNPFNPTTTINYSIAKESFVTIKVYDFLGREIKTLVNEEKPAGSYDVTFNANNLSSGIYFYAIKAGDFVQAKKMILLK